MLEKVIMAGFGGQGLLFMGKLVAQIMMDQGKHVTYFPSYGAEVRGGTANCHVIISEDEIYSPVIEAASTLVIMNGPSYVRFAPRLEPDGLLLLNTSIATEYEPIDSGTIIEIPATEEANTLGDPRVANMVMMGAYAEARNFVSIDVVLDQLAKVLAVKKPEMLTVNRAAINRGREILRENAEAGQFAVS
ncbi:MAG: 2-oxoacid:acceptor oxidoreductase family protein [Planctomycetes bacterium]|nr:2-oxoacid:acceptor oxidoreductase family protein [Planctomycetota bacterium]